jgi:hypothetical protein
MGLGTKNRQKQTADICKHHLRDKYRDKLGLVEEFIVEIEDLSTATLEVLGASPLNSRSAKQKSSGDILMPLSLSSTLVRRSLWFLPESLPPPMSFSWVERFYFALGGGR